MIEQLRDLSQLLAIAFYGFGAGSAWTAAIAAPNASYDNLDARRADLHVRSLLVNVSTQVCFVVLLGAGLAFFAQAFTSGIIGMVAAIGFFTHRWTLAPHRRSASAATRKKQRGSARRVVAVSLTLVLILVILVAIGFAVARI
ncbi:hypothetical protein [Henriciella litoralis]|uniref:hypothetical protein n=1 Tax=Henriciella litoralis TaxID=568102 RepID=UPI000A0388A0|nr:hypothetical protein [Henriciella litoralis]